MQTKAVTAFRRKFMDYFGVTLHNGEYHMEVDEMICDLAGREIIYSDRYSSDEAAVAVLFHELGHFIFGMGERDCSLYTKEKRCWEFGLAIMTGVFGIQKTKDMEDVMKKCLDTYKAPRRKR